MWWNFEDDMIRGGDIETSGQAKNITNEMEQKKEGYWCGTKRSGKGAKMVFSKNLRFKNMIWKINFKFFLNFFFHKNN